MHATGDLRTNGNILLGDDAVDTDVIITMEQTANGNATITYSNAYIRCACY